MATLLVFCEIYKALLLLAKRVDMISTSLKVRQISSLSTPLQPTNFVLCHHLQEIHTWILSMIIGFPTNTAGLCSLAPILGTLILMIGTNMFAAGATAAGIVVNYVVVVVSFGAIGGGFTVMKTARRRGSVDKFECKALKTRLISMGKVMMWIYSPDKQVSLILSQGIGSSKADFWENNEYMKLEFCSLLNLFTHSLFLTTFISSLLPPTILCIEYFFGNTYGS